MSRKPLDLTGQRYGRLVCLTLLDERTKQGSTVWQCKCDCGKLTNVTIENLRGEQTKSCGCLAIEHARKLGKRVRLDKGIAAFNKIFRGYQTRASQRSLSFTLSEKEFRKLTKLSCHYCGQKPKQIVKHKEDYGTYIYNGIDRVDNTIGYISSNCVPCCKDCNFMKRKLPVDEFIKHIKKIYEYMSE